MTRKLSITICLGIASLMLVTESDAKDFDQLYGYMIEANKAQIVVLKEKGLVSNDLARQLAEALIEVDCQGVPPQSDSQYPDYLELESRLIDLIGVEASDIHIGRSRNDLGATMNLMLMRQQILDLAESIGRVRLTLHDIASEHVDTVMPGFTHAVQAQPTTLAHFFLAFDAGLQRDSERLRQTYQRVNLSPLGSGAFTTSGFALDRDRLAGLLAFPAVVENSYDAIMVNPAETKVEFASVLSISALNIGRLAQYLLFQYDDPAPGILLTGEITGRSSIMPQKRNPSAIERLRLAASEVVGKAHTSCFLVHNTPMYEVKDARQDHLYRLNKLVHSALLMYQKLDEILRSLTIRPDLLRQKVDQDYSTMTELADTLRREGDVPFRIGHEVASKLTTYGRSKGKVPNELTYGEVAGVYREVVGEEFPLSEEQMKKAFDSAGFVTSRQGAGGPQPQSISLMLEAQQQEIGQLQRWIDDESADLEKAAALLDLQFRMLVE